MAKGDSARGIVPGGNMSSQDMNKAWQSEGAYDQNGRIGGTGVPISWQTAFNNTSNGVGNNSTMMKSPSIMPSPQHMGMGGMFGSMMGGMKGMFGRQYQRPIFPANGMPTPPVMNIGNQQGFLNNVQQPDSPLSSVDPGKLNPSNGTDFNGTLGSSITGGFDLMKLLGLR